MASAGKVRRDAIMAFKSFDIDNSGELDAREVRNVLEALTGTTPTSAEVHFMLKEMDADRDQMISQKEFVDWFTKNVVGDQGHRLNRLLVKDRLGKARQPSYKLPPPSYTYGKKGDFDEYGAKAAVSSWQGSDRAPPAGRRFEPDRTKMVHGKINTRPPTPIKAVVENSYGQDSTRHETYYPRHTAREKTQSKRAAAATRAPATTFANELRTLAAYQKTGDFENAMAAGPNKMQDGWKMRKYVKAAPRINTYRDGKHEAYQSLKKRVSATNQRAATKSAGREKML